MGQVAQVPGTTQSLMSRATLRDTAGRAPAASQGTLPSAAGPSPVALVVHRHEIHEEHVVRHGVHAEELHLERGEHAPGGSEASSHGQAGESRATPPWTAQTGGLRPQLCLAAWPPCLVSLYSAALI